MTNEMRESTSLFVAAQPAAESSRALARVLVVEDERDVGEVIAAGLQARGYVAHLVPNAVRARERIEAGDVDIVVLDVRLPGESGLELCASIRAAGPLPVIMVSGADTLADRVAGFDAGADDYVVKPVHPIELGMRVEAVLRRAGRPVGGVLVGPGGLSLDLGTGEALLEGRRVRLTRSEAGLLRVLIERAGTAVSAEELCRRVWEYEAVGDSNFIQQHISRLRRKLRDLGLGDGVIQTVYGVGYTMATPGVR